MNPDRVILLRYQGIVKGLTELWINCILFDTIFPYNPKRFLNLLAFIIDNVRIHTYSTRPMTLPSEGKKLTKNEEESMNIALNEVGIRAIHPDRMEALGAHLVEKLKGHATNKQGWRTCNPLDD